MRYGWTSVEAKIQLTNAGDRGERQWDTGSPPFGCWRPAKS